MLKFHDIEIEDVDRIRVIINEHKIISSLYSIYNLYALREKYNTKICYCDDVLYIRQTTRDIPGYNCYLFPVNSNNIGKSLALLWKDAKKLNHKVLLWGLTYKMTIELKRFFPKDICEEIPDWEDYIYRKEGINNCKTMKKADRFKNKYEGKYEIEEISSNNLHELLQFQNKWMHDNMNNNNNIESLEFEHKSIIETLKFWGRLPLKGYCIKINGKIVGFIYGLLQNSDCFTIHVIKTDKMITGLTLFLMKYLINSINVNYINFEEDIGIEGLRTFKTRLEPIYKLKKYKVCI